MTDLASLPNLPSRDLLGGEVVALDVKAGTASIRFRPPEAMANPNGTLQGGFILAMLDDVSGMLSWFAGGEKNFATSVATVNYLQPVAMQQDLLADASIRSADKKQLMIEAVLRVEGSDEPLARASLVNVFV
ncbi:MAG: PaaI family thioesterase [Gammaproteobacteria bacterium]